MNSMLTSQIAYLARRSILRLLRQPEVIVPALLFPLLIFALQAAGLSPAADIPGFPADSYFAFLLAFPLVQGALFAAVSAGTDLAKDIETGFLDRLALTPMRPAALLIGLLTGVCALGFLQAIVFIVTGLLFGVDIKAGFLGVLVLILFNMLTALGFGGIGAILALRTGSGESVQGLFPLLLVSFFLSSVLLPRDLIDTGWFKTVATYNPISYLVEGIRSLIITGWDPQALLYGFLVVGVVIVLSIAGAVISLKGRVART